MRSERLRFPSSGILEATRGAILARGKDGIPLLVEQLRSAGANYPATIRDRYLQLPNTLPQRVKGLAQQIVTDAKATNP